MTLRSVNGGILPFVHCFLTIQSYIYVYISRKSDPCSTLFVNTRKYIKSKLFQHLQRFHGNSNRAFMGYMSKTTTELQYLEYVARIIVAASDSSVFDLHF